MGHLSESCAEPRFSACSVPRGARSAGAQSYQVLGSMKEEKRICWVLACYEVFRWSFAPGGKCWIQMHRNPVRRGLFGRHEDNPALSQKKREGHPLLCVVKAW